MKGAFAAASAIVLTCAGMSAHAHRLDEYLQATTFALEQDRIQVEIRLIPGVMVVPQVLASIDTDKNGVISRAETAAYANRMQRDLSLAIDGRPLRLRLASSDADDAETLRRGLGEIHLRFVVDVPASGAHRRLVFENRHARRIATYLVNCLVPGDPNIRIVAQDRNRAQSRYQLDYAQAGPRSAGTDASAARFPLAE